MPIGGFVISCDPSARERAENALASIEAVGIYGADEKGNVVVVIDTKTSEEMDDLVKSIGGIDGVLSVGLVYLNAEDEVERGAPRSGRGVGRGE